MGLVGRDGGVRLLSFLLFFLLICIIGKIVVHSVSSSSIVLQLVKPLLVLVDLLQAVL